MLINSLVILKIVLSICNSLMVNNNNPLYAKDVSHISPGQTFLQAFIMIILSLTRVAEVTFDRSSHISTVIKKLNFNGLMF